MLHWWKKEKKKKLETHFTLTRLWEPDIKKAEYNRNNKIEMDVLTQKWKFCHLVLTRVQTLCYCSSCLNTNSDLRQNIQASWKSSIQQIWIEVFTAKLKKWEKDKYVSTLKVVHGIDDINHLSTIRKIPAFKMFTDHIPLFYNFHISCVVVFFKYVW